ncbi:helix-turn-helix domain-containing protein [Methylobacterium planeticum]|nr:XRE family transcriptional regulator [Methylobacterium planeticum]
MPLDPVPLDPTPPDATGADASGADEAGTDLATVSSAPAERPRSLERALGHQIRTLRRERDLSVSDLAAAAGISLGMVSKIENGQISPSLSTINAVAGALNVPLSSLFSAFEEKRDCSYVRGGQGVIIERRGTKVGHVYELLGAALGGDVVVEPYLITLREDAEAYTGFRHAGVEFIYMLSGEVVYRHADRSYTLAPGDALLFDSGAVHGPESLVGFPISYLSIIIYPRQAS